MAHINTKMNNKHLARGAVFGHDRVWGRGPENLKFDRYYVTVEFVGYCVGRGRYPCGKLHPIGNYRAAVVLEETFADRLAWHAGTYTTSVSMEPRWRRNDIHDSQPVLLNSSGLCKRREEIRWRWRSFTRRHRKRAAVGNIPRQDALYCFIPTWWVQACLTDITRPRP